MAKSHPTFLLSIRRRIVLASGAVVETMIETSARHPAGIMNTGSLRLHSLVAVFILACSLFARAQSDASGNDAGSTGVQQVVHNASTGARWDHDVANAPTANASVANVKVSVDASKLRNIVGYRAFGIQTSVSDNDTPVQIKFLN
jgi:hypothetical protein